MSTADFGRDAAPGMPPHLFRDALRVDWRTAVRAQPDRQNCSVCPRHWYVDATFRCRRCRGEFTFTADEQRVWYEVRRFWVDSIPVRCAPCRQAMREVRALRQEYDRGIAAALEGDDAGLKRRLLEVIDRLEALGAASSARMQENRSRLRGRSGARA